MSVAYLKLTAEELKGLSEADLYARNEALMSIHDEVNADQLLLHAELNHRHTLKKFNAMTDAEKEALTQHIRAGNLDTAGRRA